MKVDKYLASSFGIIFALCLLFIQFGFDYLFIKVIGALFGALMVIAIVWNIYRRDEDI